MAKNLALHDHLLKDDHIDMNIFLNYSPQRPTRDFEFHVSSNRLEDITDDDHSIPSPADKLFYRGNLLPLHLPPPRFQLVEQLLLQKTSKKSQQHYFTTAPTTPLDSCNISPATSCYVSGELNPEGFYECPADMDLILESHEKTKKNKTKKLWSRNLKLINNYSSLGVKLKASRAFLKSLFAKSACSDEENCATDRKRRTSSNKSCSSNSSSSSNSSVNSNGYHGEKMMKRSSSVNSENECSIQGAIAYCKKSQQQVCGRKSTQSDVEFYLLSESRLTAEKKNEMNCTS